MNTVVHPIAPEEVMAWLDGELSEADARAVSVHLDDCVECASLADEFRATSRSLSQWTVPPVPSSLEEFVLRRAASPAHISLPAKPGRSIQLSFWNWRLWAIGGGGAVAAVLILAAIVASTVYREDHVRSSPPMAAMLQSPEPEQMATRSAGEPRSARDEMSARRAGAVQYDYFDSRSAPPAAADKAVGIMGGALGPHPQPAPAPMIARTVSLSIVVKDFAASRMSLDAILVRHHGYAAQLTAATAENTPRSIQASLRIPSPELAAALGEFKTLGLVQNESQSGEEVTQQHTDLVARLKNSRETEERLRAILEQRTGKIEDVLQVEEEIARVRGEIENMEADQQALEHRVDFATVDLQLTEEYTARLDQPSRSISNRLHNSLVAGLRNAGDTLLGVVLLLEQDGPVLLIWLTILGLPAFLLFRRYRRVKARL
jgi:hypothetical protein